MPIHHVQAMYSGLAAASVVIGAQHFCSTIKRKSLMNSSLASSSNISSTQVQVNDDNNGFIGFLKTWLPFINEAAGVLEHSGLKIFKGIYKVDSIQRMFIDAVALSSMLWNTATEAEEKDSKKGLWKGLGLLLFSFFAPTYLMSPVVEGLAKLRFAGGIFNKPIGRIASGVALIAALELCVQLWDDKIVPLLENAYHKAHSIVSSFKGKREIYKQT